MLKFYDHLLTQSTGGTGVPAGTVAHASAGPSALQQRPKNTAAAWRLAVIAWMQDPGVRYYASTPSPIKEWSAFHVIGLLTRYEGKGVARRVAAKGGIRAAL